MIVNLNAVLKSVIFSLCDKNVTPITQKRRAYSPYT